MIMETVTRKNGNSSPPVKQLPMFATLALLDKFMPAEKPGHERKHVTKANRNLSKLETAFSKAMTAEWELEDERDAEYKKLLKVAKKMNYTPKDIEFLSISLENHVQNDDAASAAGLFLSVLINNCNDSDFSIFAKNCMFPLSYLCEKNAKNVKIIGDVHDEFAVGMLSGSIILEGNADMFALRLMEGGNVTIHGNVGQYACNLMKGGSLTVNGNAGEDMARGMKGGTITINGDVLNDLGSEMTGGTICVNGNISRLGLIKGGNVFQRGRQLVKDGMIICQPENK